MNVEELCRDLLAERVDLFDLLALVGDGWSRPTPAEGWSIRDQVTHLAWFDEAARQAIAEPVAFVTGRDAARNNVGQLVESIRVECSSRDDGEIVGWLRAAGEQLAATARAADPGMRVPWYGPAMSLASCITARIMETWAHGQDVFDAVGVTRRASPRLHHVAFIGWRAMANRLVANNLPVPTEPVRVELDGGHVAFGPVDAVDRVHGSLVDFCLLVTRRRHLADTDMVAEGRFAAAWLPIAQAFAGAPGSGRSPGQFR